jgi:DNA polymerase V
VQDDTYDWDTSQRTTGYPSPAEDFVEASLDVRELLVKHPTATFFVRVEGEAMRASGIRDGDILVVDRALDPAPGAIIVASIADELLVRRVGSIDAYGITLVSSDESTIHVTGPIDLILWGVVSWVLHPFRS